MGRHFAERHVELIRQRRRETGESWGLGHSRNIPSVGRAPRRRLARAAASRPSSATETVTPHSSPSTHEQGGGQRAEVPSCGPPQPIFSRPYLRLAGGAFESPSHPPFTLSRSCPESPPLLAMPASIRFTASRRSSSSTML